MVREHYRSKFIYTDGFMVGVRACNSILLESLRKDERLLQEVREKIETEIVAMDSKHIREMRNRALNAGIDVLDYSKLEEGYEDAVQELLREIGS